MQNYDELMFSIEKRFKTTMIGALAQFEKYFGYLWENDSPNREKFENLWEDTRNNILNNGNNQIRLALRDLEQTLYNKPKFKQQYHYKFYFKDQNNEGDYQ